MRQCECVCVVCLCMCVLFVCVCACVRSRAWVCVIVFAYKVRGFQNCEIIVQQTHPRWWHCALETNGTIICCQPFGFHARAPSAICTTSTITCTPAPTRNPSLRSTIGSSSSSRSSSTTTTSCCWMLLFLHNNYCWRPWPPVPVSHLDAMLIFFISRAPVEVPARPHKIAFCCC